MAVTNYGGRIVGLYVPDKNGQIVDVNIGRSSIANYTESDEAYFGCIVGRVGNRIAKGKFSLDGNSYTVPTNNGENSLHGGDKGFNQKVWDAEQPDNQTLILTYTSPDREEGFPGNLTTRVTYSLIEDGTVQIAYKATTDKSTVVNLTNHAYFNLNGEGTGTILNHEIQIYADHFVPVNKVFIPTGTIQEVANTPLDFRQLHKIGERIDIDYEQLNFVGGYDHTYVLGKRTVNNMYHAATVRADTSGIVLDVFTQEPGVQFYTGNSMESKNILKSGAKDDYRTAFCLETQHYPDAPNQPDFPSIRLEPKETYQTISQYKFSVQ